MYVYRAFAHPIWVLAVILPIAHPALAQDPNIETRIEQYVEPPSIKPLQPTVRTIEVRKPETVTTTVKKPDAEVLQELNAALAQDQNAKTDKVGSALNTLILQKGLPPDATPFALQEGVQKGKIDKLDPAFRCELLDQIKGRSCRRKITDTIFVASSKKVVEPPKTEVVAALNTNYQFDSNARSARSGAVEDRFINTTPSVKITVPMPANSEFLAAVSTAYARYDNLSDIDSDVLQATLAYGRTLYSVEQTPNSATKRSEVVTIRMVGTGSYQPGFSGPGTRYYSPALLWELRGLALDDSLCGKAKALVNCWVAAVGVEVGQTWYGSEGKAKNARAAVTGSLDWNIRGKELVWGVSGTITERYYEDFPGDRNDVFFSGGTTLTWNPNANLTLSAAAEYRKQTSTQEAVEYDKYVLFPRVVARLSF